MRVLIIGLGSIAKKHITALKEIYPNVELFALRSSVSAMEVNGVVSVYEYDKIKDLAIDFMIISNPTFKHKETIERLLHLGLPFFIEKPLFDKLEEEALLNTIADKGIVTYVACNLRFLECIKFARDFIKGNRINEVNVYCGSYLPDWRPDKNFRELYSSNETMGGGVHLDLIHEIDYVYWFFGNPLNVRHSLSSKSSLNIDAIDYANYLLEYKDFKANIILNYFRRDAKRNLEIVCEDGTLYINLLKNEVWWRNEIIFSSKKKIIDTYKDQIRFFIENILTKKTTFNNIFEAYEILKICMTKE